MSRNYSNKRRLKYVLLALTCATSFTFTGLIAACKDDTDPDEDNKTTSKEDTQLLKNGNFEFFDVPEKKKDENAPVYLINSPNNWTHGGTTSYTMSGIIGTSKTAWDKLADESLAETLDFNNGLDSSASNYKSEHVDYNGMKSSDILYKNTYEALNYKDKDDEDKSEEAEKAAFERIENPGTHYLAEESDGKVTYVNEKGERVNGYIDEKGDYFFDEEFKQPFSHILMLHNYATEHNGIAQKYASVSVDLPANTAAEISVWVKTQNLFFSQGKTVNQDRGANITVTQTVGSTTLDPFTISCINTEKLLGGEKGEYDGWVQYSIFVNACDFASSTVSIELGLGESNYNVEGYAFFDDITVTKVKGLDIDEENLTVNGKDLKVGDKVAKCDLLSDASEKIFKADSYERNGGEVKDDRFSKNFTYFVDLAATTEYKDVKFDSVKNLKTGLTVDADKFTSSDKMDIGHLLGFGSAETIGNAKLPVDFTALATSSDLLAYYTAGTKLNVGNGFEYNKLLNDALETSSAKLPKINSATENNMLVMLSAYGAAYTTSFSLPVKNDTQQIVSFWVKTSDMDGGTAATIKITEAGNKDNTASITLDTTNKSTDIGKNEDEKDIFEGWVQCFFFVKNDVPLQAGESEENNTKFFNIEFSFGNTTIKDTKVNAYKPGWVALANMQVMEKIPDKIFGYTSTGDYAASLTLVEDSEKKTSVFDEAYGSQSHDIENGIVNPSTYTGVNGGSSSVVNNGYVSVPFDEINSNENAGLINKEYFENYSENNLSWYTTLLESFEKSGLSPEAAWNEIFGTKSLQPMLIVNKNRPIYTEVKGVNEDNFKDYLIKDEEGDYKQPAEFDKDETYYTKKEVTNYGFIGENKTVSADSYATISVKVKVSKGAVAYVYLVDTSSGKKVLDFNTPGFTFWYDTDGNVLKAEHNQDATIEEQRANVLYSLRDDGLYEDKDGKLFANTHNFIKTYTDQTASYFTEKGESITFDKLISGETYYSDSAHTKIANHFLTNTDGTKIFEYKDGNYYYIVEGKTQTSVVTPFDTQYARYTAATESYVQVIDGNKVSNNEWQTVTFVIHAGSEAKNYRLELWSGERDKLTTEGNNDGGVVLFDYSYSTITDNTLMSEYETEIIKAYQRLLIDKELMTSFDSSAENIAYYEKLVADFVKENKLSENEVNAIKAYYTAHYYTFSLYDSENFLPFNKNVNENSSGYDYNVDDQTESLAYLKITDGNTCTVFADYSSINKSISLDTSTDDDDNDADEEETETDSSVWLLISSILLVFAMFFAMGAIFIKDLLKKRRRNKVTGKNTYNQNKTNRYMKKLGVKKEEIEEVDGAVNAEESVEEPNEPVETEEPEQVEQPDDTTDENND